MPGTTIKRDQGPRFGFEASAQEWDFSNAKIPKSYEQSRYVIENK
jgi:hypothetical protein